MSIYEQVMDAAISSVASDMTEAMGWTYFEADSGHAALLESMRLHIKPFYLDVAAKAAAFDWLHEMRLHLSETAALDAPVWYVLDVDGDCIAGGNTPLEAVEAARTKVGN